MKTCYLLPATCYLLPATCYLLIAAWSPDIQAEYLYDQECNEFSDGPFYHPGTTTTRELFVYIENDFASEMTTCTPSTDDSSVSESDVRTVLEQAMEVWNLESQGITLHYGGSVPTGNYGTACDSYMVKRPAIFVNFYAGCKIVNGSCDDAIATTYRKDSDCGHIRVWGNKFVNNCSQSTATAWSLDVDQAVPNVDQSLRTALIHELGHAINVGHSNQPTGPDAMLMSGGSNDFRFHLLPYDKDCARLNHNGRSLEYQTMWRSTLLGATDYKSPETHYFGTTHGMVSGGFMGENPELMGLYTATVTANPLPVAYFEWTTPFPDYEASPSFYGYTATAQNVRYLHVSPTLFSNPADPNSDNHMFSLDEGSVSGGTVTEIDPPRLNLFHSNDKHASGANYAAYACTNYSGTSCSATQQIQTNVPPSTAYDPISGETIVARVNTLLTTSGGNRTGGTIWIHPGFHYQWNTLRVGKPVQQSTTGATYAATAGHGLSTLQYNYETDFPVGVACAPNNDGVNWGPYNCLLAWVERGVPWGQILYTYFRVNESSSPSTIDWAGKIYARSSAQASGGVQAAYIEREFRMAFKKRLGAETVGFCRNGSGSHSGWNSVQSESAPGIVGMPTFLYYEEPLAIDGNHAIVYTSSDTSNN